MTKSFLRKAGRVVYGRLLPRRPYRVISGPLRGSRFILGSMSGAGGGASVYFNQVETEQTAVMLREVATGETFFDIGANVGYYSILASRLVGPKGKVIAFEPVVRNIAYLQRHIELNKAANVQILPFAVSGETGISSFSSGPHDSMGSLDFDHGVGDMLVATITLDEIAGQLKMKPDVIKIDVEGAEMEVFRGAERTLHEHKPKIFLSTHSNELRSECLGHLKDLGYIMETLTGSDDPHEFFLKHTDRDA